MLRPPCCARDSSHGCARRAAPKMSSTARRFRLPAPRRAAIGMRRPSCCTCDVLPAVLRLQCRDCRAAPVMTSSQEVRTNYKMQIGGTGAVGGPQMIRRDSALPATGASLPNTHFSATKELNRRNRMSNRCTPSVAPFVLRPSCCARHDAPAMLRPRFRAFPVVFVMPRPFCCSCHISFAAKRAS